MRIFRFFPVIGVLMLSQMLAAQTPFMIKGKVIDSLTRNPVTDVQVMVGETKNQVLTDHQGRFSVSCGVMKSLTLVFSHMTYETRHIDIPDREKSAGMVVVLRPRVINLGEFVVEGEVTPASVAVRIPELQIRQSANRDIGDFLRAVPNLSAVRKGGTGLDPVVRGLKFSQLNVQIDDGLRVEGGCPNRMDPTTAHVEIEEIESMEIIKGPYVLRYGPSFGGIINLKTYQPAFSEKPEFHVTAMTGFESNWNGSREHLLMQYGSRRWGVQLSAGTKNYGSYRDGEDNTVKSGFHRYGFAGALGFKPSENQELLFNFRESRARDVFYPALPMDERIDNTTMYSFDYTFRNIGKWLQSLEMKSWYTTVHHVMDNYDRSNFPLMDAVADADATSAGINLFSSWTFGKALLNLGLDLEQTSKDGDRVVVMTMVMPGMDTVVNTIRTNLWYNAYINNYGLYAEYRRSIGDYSVEFSWRGDLNTAGAEDTLLIIRDGHTYFGETASTHLNFSLNAGVTRMFGKSLSLSLALGRGVRSPNLTERYIKFLTIGYDNYDYLGDPQLKPEAIHQADLTLRFMQDRVGEFYLNGFFSVITDFITGRWLPPSVATPKTNTAYGVKQFYNAKYALLRGVEFSYQSPVMFSRLYLSAQGSYTRASIDEAVRYIVENNKVTGQESLGNDPLPEIPPLEGSVSLSARFMKDRLMPSLQMRLVSSQDYISRAYNEASTPGFMTLNAFLSYRPIRWMTVSTGVNNLFDRLYYEHLNRRIIGSTGKLYEPGRVFHLTLIAKI